MFAMEIPCEVLVGQQVVLLFVLFTQTLLVQRHQVLVLLYSTQRQEVLVVVEKVET